MKRSSLVFTLLTALLLASCTSLPSSGPRPDTFSESARWEYIAQPEADGGKDSNAFVLVNVDGKLVDAVQKLDSKKHFKGSFEDRRPPSDITLGVGDILRITIFEAGPGGLFLSSNAVTANGNFITLPDQEVDQTGHISVPYAEKDGDSAQILVHGKRPAEVQHEIQKRLMNKAIEPQVVVSVIKRNSNMYSVIGDVNSAGRFNLTQSGIRILDALSIAGGPKGSDYNTLVTLQRGTSTASARLSSLLNVVENNIYVQPNDLIAVKRDERYYNVLGSTKNNNRIAFESEIVTVADALAKAGGLDGESAEPEMVVVMRREYPSTLESIGVTLEGIEHTDPLPTVYRFDLTQPSGIFLAQRMPLNHDDVVYVSTHAFKDASKLLSILRDALLISLISD
jgi:polysaccharide export outer membrane protein